MVGKKTASVKDAVLLNIKHYSQAHPVSREIPAASQVIGSLHLLISLKPACFNALLRSSSLYSTVPAGVVQVQVLLQLLKQATVAMTAKVKRTFFIVTYFYCFVYAYSVWFSATPFYDAKIVKKYLKAIFFKFFFILLRNEKKNVFLHFAIFTTTKCKLL